MYAECKLCGVIIHRVTTHTLLTHILRYHLLAEFVNKNSVCKKCGKKLVRTKSRWTFDLYEHIRNEHTLVDYFTVTTSSTLELIEFMCDYCYRRGNPHIRALIERAAIEEQRLFMICSWCGNKMIPTKVEFRERYKDVL